MLGNLKCENPEVSEICISLYRQRVCGDISQEELEKELAYVSLKYGFETIEPLPTPLIPAAVASYKNLRTAKEREAFLMEYPDFFSPEGTAGAYYIALQRAEMHNYKWLNWLYDMEKSLAEDEVNLERVRKKIRLFDKHKMVTSSKDEYKQVELLNEAIRGKSRAWVED